MARSAAPVATNQKVGSSSPPGRAIFSITYRQDRELTEPGVGTFVGTREGFRSPFAVFVAGVEGSLAGTRSPEVQSPGALIFDPANRTEFQGAVA